MILGLLHTRPAQPLTTGVVTPLPDGPTVLVMPFQSLGEGEEASLYAAGVTEEILIQLSGFKDLAVLGATSTTSTPTDRKSSTRDLAVRYWLTGSLRLAGPEMRVTSRLVDAGTGTVLWAQSYEENLGVGELFAIQ